MALEYDVNYVEQSKSTFIQTHPNASVEDIRKYADELRCREVIVKMWVDAYKRFDPNGKNPDKVFEYTEKIRKTPTPEMRKTFVFFDSTPAEKRDLYMTTVQERAKKAEDMTFLEEQVPQEYKIGLNTTPEAVIEKAKGPGDEYFDGLFAATTDSSKMLYGKDAPGIDRSKVFLTWEEIREKQAETDSIVIEPNDKVSKELVPFIVMGKFFTRENLDGMKKYLYGPGSTIPKGFNAVIGAKSNFYDNTIINDGRINMHSVRLFAPEARRKAKAIIESENMDEIKSALSTCFHEMFVQANGSYSIESSTWLAPVRKLGEFMDTIRKNGLEPESLGISKDQIDRVKVLKAIYDLQIKHSKLKADLLRKAEESFLTEDAKCNIYENPQLMKKLEDELVLRREIATLQKSIQGILNSYDPAGPEACQIHHANRIISEAEVAFMADPAKFENDIREEVRSLKETNREFNEIEKNSRNSFNLLCSGIKVSVQDTVTTKLDINILMGVAFDDTINRINTCIKDTSLEQSLAPTVEALINLRNTAQKPYSKDVEMQYATLTRSIQDQCNEYASTLKPEEMANEKTAFILQMCGAVGSSGNYFYNRFEEENQAAALKRREEETENLRVEEEIKNNKLVDENILNDLDDMAGALAATEGNWTSNSPEYDAFSAELKAISGRLEDKLDVTNQDALNEMAAAEGYATDYLRTHEVLESPSNRQKQRMAVARQFKAYYAKTMDRKQQEYERAEYDAAKKWYEGFKKTLIQEGIDINTPYALASINILHDTKFTEDQLNAAQTSEEKQALLSETEKLYSYAFMKQNKDGEYDVKRPGGKLNLDWLKSNMQSPANLKDVDIVRLYRSAKDCRLVLRDPQFGSDAVVSPKYFAVTNNGEAVLTGKGDAFLPEKSGKVSAKASDFNISEQDAEKIASREDARKLISINRKLMRAEFYSPNVFANNNSRDEFQAMHDADQLEKDFCTVAAKHPLWVNSPEKIQSRMQVLKASSLSEDIMTEDEVQLVKDDLIFTATFQDTMASVFKRMKTDDIEAIMESGKILKADKTAFNKDDTYEFANEICHAANFGQGIWMEYEKNGKTVSGVFVQNADLGLCSAVNVKLVVEQIRQNKQAIDEMIKDDHGPGLENISAALERQLKESVNAINRHYDYVPDGHYNSINSVFNTAYKNYVDALPQNEVLSPVQIKTLKVLADLNVYAENAIRMPGNPSQISAERLAVTRICNKAEQLLASDKPEDAEKGRKLLTNSEERKKAAAELMNSPQFKNEINGKKYRDVEKLRRHEFRIADNADEIFLESEKLNKESYENEAKYIKDLFDKTKLNPNKEGPDYKFLKEIIGDLPEQIAELDFNKSQAKIDLQAMIAKAAAVGNTYARGLGNAVLSKGQLACLKAVNRLNDLKDAVFADVKEPSKGNAYKLAEKIATATAIKNAKKDPNAREYLFNQARRKKVIELIKKQPAFKKVLSASKQLGIDKAMKIRGDKLCEMYEKNCKQIVKESEPPKPELTKTDDLMKL